MRAYVVDGRKAEFAEVKDDVHEFYRLIGCDCIDIARRWVGGLEFDIVVDDEGLLKDRPSVTMVDATLTPMLVGTLLFFGHEGCDLRSLTDREAEVLVTHTYGIGDGDRVVVIAD